MKTLILIASILTACSAAPNAPGPSDSGQMPSGTYSFVWEQLSGSCGEQQPFTETFPLTFAKSADVKCETVADPITIPSNGGVVEVSFDCADTRGFVTTEWGEYTVLEDQSVQGVVHYSISNVQTGQECASVYFATGTRNPGGLS